MPQQMPQPMPQPAQKQRKRPPAALRIDTPAHNPQIAHVVQDSITSASATDSAASDYFSSPFNNMPRSSRNKLSLTLSSARSSTHSLTLVDRADEPPQTADPTNRPNRPRRPSVISLPPPSNPTSLLQRREEEEGDGEPSYSDGPIQIIPNVWLGSEENARDWKTLHTLGIKCILNVAKEVSSPFDSVASIVPRPLRPVASTPNLNNSKDESKGTYYPPHVPSGRPGMHYLKMQWSHGQQNLVDEGFPDAMSFCDAAQDRGEGVLIHCQCGVSRSATMVIALVMRAAAENSPHVPPEIWELKGMQGAYSYVKEKSKWVSPNMSLIYQLIEYERKLKGDSSPASSERSSAIAEEEEEWGRRRRLLDESEGEDDAQAEAERESNAVLAEAQALDKAMEARIVAKRASASSLTSNSSGLGNGVGMGPAWRNRYSARKRTGSVASSCHSMISEDLVEEDEEQALLGVGGGFDDDRPRLSFASSTNSSATSSVDPESATNSPEDGDGTYPNVSSPSDDIFTPATARPLPSISAFPLPPPSAPAWKTSFSAQRISVPHTASRATFDLSVDPLDRSSVPRSAFEDVSTTPKPVTRKPIKSRKRPPLGSLVLPPVPSSPITIIADEPESPAASQCPSVAVSDSTTLVDVAIQRPNPPPRASVPLRIRTESRKPVPPPLHLRNSTPPKAIYSASSSLESQHSNHARSNSLSSSSSSVSNSQSISVASSRHSSSSSLSIQLPTRPSLQSRKTSQPIPSQAPIRPSLPRSQSTLNTPSQTLFVFPPSPTLNTRTPSTMTLTMSHSVPSMDHRSTSMRSGPVPFPSLSTPRVETFKGKHGRTRSFIGLGAPSTPTTACSRVDAKGWVGVE